MQVHTWQDNQLGWNALECVHKLQVLPGNRGARGGTGSTVVQAPEVVPMAVPKVLEVSAAHDVAKELPTADPPQLAYNPGDWSSASGGVGETTPAGACPRPSPRHRATARL